MGRLQIYLKVTIDTEENEERPERLGLELCRQVSKVYGVKHAEVSSIIEEP